MKMKRMRGGGKGSKRRRVEAAKGMVSAATAVDLHLFPIFPLTTRGGTPYSLILVRFINHHPAPQTQFWLPLNLRRRRKNLGMNRVVEMMRHLQSCWKTRRSSKTGARCTVEPQGRVSP